jgi:hypothetical protein
MGCVILTSHYPSSILHQDILDARLMYMEPTCMDLATYVFWCKIDVG